ncbi:MAG: hypothetical protein NWE89_15300 [Candidatus Bathyarchaeota archaeon]|nr:hypothetical protein [Candidatus Bathyarchaeota archaeon]
MKSSKLIGLLIIVVQLAGVVALGLGMYTMISVFSTAIPQGENEIVIQYCDPVIIPFSITPSNPGYLDAELSISMSLIVDGDNEIASDSVIVTIPPQSQVPVNLELSLSQALAEEYLQEGADVDWVIDLQITTLYDLISFSNTITMSGGGQ